MKCSQQQMENPSSANVPVSSAAKSRRGFTLVELLVVIAIIGILISMLAVALGPVLIRTQEGAVTTELRQLDLAIENFNNQYGFYPPSFGGLPNAVRDSGSSLDGGQYNLATPWDSDSAVPAGEELQLLPFLNKISPNHRENAGAAPTPLRMWWVNIGRHLDDRSSLVFWLSGLCANKQFPLTGNLPAVGGQIQLPVAFGLPQSIRLTGNGTRNTSADLAVDSMNNTIDVPRDSFFDFRGGQLATEALDNLTSVTTVSVDNRTSPTLAPGLRVYNTRFGDSRANRGNAYFYRDSGGYNTSGGGFYAVDSAGRNQFINPNTFQIFTFGRDGEARNFPLSFVPVGPAQARAFATNNDNLANFAEGRLEAFDWRANLGL